MANMMRRIFLLRKICLTNGTKWILHRFRSFPWILRNIWFHWLWGRTIPSLLYSSPLWVSFYLLLSLGVCSIWIFILLQISLLFLGLVPCICPAPNLTVLDLILNSSQDSAQVLPPLKDHWPSNFPSKQCDQVSPPLGSHCSFLVELTTMF